MSPQKGGKHGPRRRVPTVPRFEPLEPRALLAGVVGQDVAFGLVDGRNVVARLAPAPGLRVTVSMTGPGSGAAMARDGGRVDLRLEGTTGQTVVTVKSAGRLALSLGRLDVRGPLGALRAPAAVLSGILSLDHPLGELTVGKAHDLTVDAAGVAVGSVSATSWTDDPSTPRDTITADSLARLEVGPAARARKGRAAAPVADFAAELDVPRLGTVSVAGNATLAASFVSADAIVVGRHLRSSTIRVMPTAPGQEASLGRLAVGGTMGGVKVVALGDVGAVTAVGMNNSEVLAGVRYGRVGDTFEHVLPMEHSLTGEAVPRDYDFVGAYRIGAVAVTGTGDGSEDAPRPRRRRWRPVPAPPASTPVWFSNSRIAAYEIGEVALDGVGTFNAARDYGVAAHVVGKVLRRFAEPRVGTERFVVRQTSGPVEYREGPDGVGGYFGGGEAGGVLIGGAFGRGGDTPELPYVNIPTSGAAIGSATVNGASPTLYLMPDGSYELRVGSDPALARDASLPTLIHSVVAAPGTPIKVVHRPPGGTTNGWVKFISTSVGGSLTLPLPANPKPYRHAQAVTSPSAMIVITDPMPVPVPVPMPPMPGPPPVAETFYTLPTVDEVRAALAAEGTETAVYDTDFLLVKPDGIEVGRAFDDTGLRKVFLTAQNGFRVVDAAGAVLWEGDDLLAALGATAPRLGARRLPVRLFGRSEIALHGLARGGSAYFAHGGRLTLGPAGDVHTLPDGAGVAERLRQAGVDFTGNGL